MEGISPTSDVGEAARYTRQPTRHPSSTQHPSHTSSCRHAPPFLTPVPSERRSRFHAPPLQTPRAPRPSLSLAAQVAVSILSRVGRKPRNVLLAAMFTATFASMWISNVAAPVLCFGLIQPILRWQGGREGGGTGEGGGQDVRHATQPGHPAILLRMVRTRGVISAPPPPPGFWVSVCSGEESTPEPKRRCYLPAPVALLLLDASVRSHKFYRLHLLPLPALR